MPNWVENKLVITGPKESLDRLAEQLSKPYTAHHYDFTTNTYPSFVVTGEFLLWNIVSPSDLPAYYEHVENEIRQQEWLQRKERTDNEPVSAGAVVNTLVEKLQEASQNPTVFQEAYNKFVFEREFGDDWYHWNIRNWGTKWEISDVVVERQNDTTLRYGFQTAWSPPESALTSLAEQYPEITMTLRCHDEGDMFAAEIHWNGGKQTFETELEINHYLMVEMYDYCHACDSQNEGAMQQYGCPAG